MSTALAKPFIAAPAAVRSTVRPQRVEPVVRVAAPQAARVLDPQRGWQQLSLFGRPLGAPSAPSRTD
jgi:hypothetical protein